MSVEELNDRLAREHPIDDYYKLSPWPIRLVERRRLAIIRDLIGDVRGLEVMEVGVGGGHVLRMFREAHLTATDVSGVYLDTARRNLVGYDVRFLKGELHELPLEVASFDRIVCTEVLEHVVDPDAMVARIAELLKPNGVAVLTVPNDPLILRIKDLVRRSPLGGKLRDRVNWGGDEFHLHQWTPDAFKRFLEQHFRVVQYRGAPVSSFPIRACFRCELR
jgi:2-polyprenyl-3-methyl-5-hydroxy-6-metoxy-1,4-benzoquinol methylase